MAKKPVENFVARALRLYGQEPGGGLRLRPDWVGRAAVRQVWAGLAENRFVLRTDVKSYYASIDHLLLLDQPAALIKDRRMLNLLGQFLRRTAERGGVFWDYRLGISLGCPLSPLMGALFLKCLDERMEKSELISARFMDDILVLSPTR